MVVEEDWGECRHCGEEIATRDAVKVTIREDQTARSTVLCPECASLNCDNCGASIPLLASLDEDRRGASHVLTCSRCEEDHLIQDMVEIRHETDPNYSKRVCGDCLDEIAIPAGYQVLRDIPPKRV